MAQLVKRTITEEYRPGERGTQLLVRTITEEYDTVEEADDDLDEVEGPPAKPRRVILASQDDRIRGGKRGGR